MTEETVPFPEMPLPPPCVHQWTILHVTVEAGRDMRSDYYGPREVTPDVTHLLLACSECGETRQESMNGRPAAR